MPIRDRTITATEASRILACSRQTVHNIIERGELLGYRAGPRAVLVSLSDVQALAAERRVHPKPNDPRNKREKNS